MKTIKKSFILLPLMAILILSSCKKDPVSGIVEVVVQDPEITPLSDIRVKKLSSSDFDDPQFEATYNYNNQGKLLNAKTVSGFQFLAFSYSSNKINIKNGSAADLEKFNYWPYWKNSTINLNQKTIKSINVVSEYPYLFSPGLDIPGISKTNTVNIYRTTNSIDTVSTVFNGFNFYNAGDYKFLAINASGLPTKIIKTYPYASENRTLKPFTKLLEITYLPAPSIPNKLKRMVNESLLDLSRFGAYSPVSQINFGLINGNQYGPDYLGYTGKSIENACIFGLHRIYTLQETSTEMVSSIKETTYYGNGTPVVKTTNYPYTHNPATRNLVVGGLSIFYDVVEVK